ncbi:hypothetical protein JOB18_029139 [Solea senegalensis]|uniref:Uncharacterized protein n=1 Tax=Solea senegalensis TaxID=28829 RepID=A0AAV6PVT1_SOLSE|nr:hypothetical protein JOB18_029139 [Solea senegalensis]
MKTCCEVKERNDSDEIKLLALLEPVVQNRTASVFPCGCCVNHTVHTVYSPGEDQDEEDQVFSYSYRELGSTKKRRLLQDKEDHAGRKRLDIE